MRSFLIRQNYDTRRRQFVTASANLFLQKRYFGATIEFKYTKFLDESFNFL